MMCFPTLGLDRVLADCAAAAVELLHIDVMDGRFVPNLMLGTNYVADLRQATDITLDLHLMIQEPGDKLDWFAAGGGDWVSVHAESTAHLQRTVERVRSLGGHPRVALNPATPLSALDWVLDDIDGILLMTVNPGYAGQALIPQTVAKIAQLKAQLVERGRADLDIEVDGNVSAPNAVAMAAAGASTFVLGTSAINLVKPLADQLRAFRAAIADA